MSNVTLIITKVLKLSVDKESRQGQRMIALSLVNPDESRFQFEGRSDSKNGVYTVEGSLSESGKRLSNVLSKFDAKNTDFVVLVDGVATGSRYRFNFGVYNETIADASVVDVNTQKVFYLFFSYYHTLTLIIFESYETVYYDT